MRSYTKQHKFYCGIDLPKKNIYLCILNQAGETLLHKNIKTQRGLFLRAIQPFMEDMVLAVECVFTWYWIADLCTRHDIPFVLGHALYMRAIHGGKAKNDRIDSYKIATLLKGGRIPQAHVYPAKMRATRDLLRQRNHFMRKRAERFRVAENVGDGCSQILGGDCAAMACPVSQHESVVAPGADLGGIKGGGVRFAHRDYKDQSRVKEMVLDAFS